MLKRHNRLIVLGFPLPLPSGWPITLWVYLFEHHVRQIRA